MNDRTKQLAIQANLSYVMTSHNPFINDDLQKFVELIVNDSVNIMKAESSQCVDHIVNQILRHFSVK